MPSFGLTPLPPFASQGESFPTGIQFQDEGLNVGPPNPQNVNFVGAEVTATYDAGSGTVNVAISGGGSGGGGFTPIGFSASLTADQSSGTTVVFNNTSTNRGQSYAGYNAGTGVLTIGAGDGGLWMFGASLDLNAGIEVAGATFNFDIRINGGTFNTSNTEVLQAGDGPTLNGATGVVRVVDGDQISIVSNQAFSSGTTGVQAVGSQATRFWALRVGD
jgi:hypothetical protein